MSQSASTPDVVREWAGDWSDTFDQDWDEAKLASWVGKKVVARGGTDEDPRGFTGVIVGYSRDTLYVDDRQVFRNSFITSEGLQVALFAKMQVEEANEE